MKNVIRISCSRANLKTVRDFVSAYLSVYHLSELHINQIVLAVDEVVANLIIHANAENESQYLQLKLAMEDHMFGIEIEDDSKESYLPSTFREPAHVGRHPAV